MRGHLYQQSIAKKSTQGGTGNKRNRDPHISVLYLNPPSHEGEYDYYKYGDDDAWNHPAILLADTCQSKEI